MIAVREPLVSPVIPPAVRHAVRVGGAGVRRPLPLALPPTQAAGTDGVVYSMGTVDRSGRVCDRAITAALRWQAGDRVSLAAHDHLVEIHRNTTGLVTLASRAYLLLPAVARRRLAIRTGDRVLLAADPARDQLTIYPLAALHHAITAATYRGDTA